MKVTETPSKWVIIKTPDCHKVFGTWSGGYLDGDRWKLNSGIKEIEEEDDNYYFIGYSGSCYKCNKNKYGVASSYGDMILSQLITKSEGKIEVLGEENWKGELGL